MKLNVGLVGLGRLGMAYARNLHFRIANAHLMAVCSLSEEELQAVQKEMHVPHLFKDFRDMLDLPDLHSVFIVSSTDQHANQMLLALQRGLHVFCEKPLAITLEACMPVVQVAGDHPELKAMVGFVRRFDKSYKYAREKIDQGAIGEPFLVRSQTVDMDRVSDFQIHYVKNSGGIFHDFNVHDIDLARWYLGSEISSVYAIGGAYKYREFEEIGDADHVMTSCQFEDGKMAIINAGRTASLGHDTYTEIVGTEGSLLIGRPAARNRVEIYDRGGARRECVETFWDRFENAFLSMASEFVHCVLSDSRPGIELKDAVMATKAASAFTASFRSGKVVHLNKQDAWSG